MAGRRAAHIGHLRTHRGQEGVRIGENEDDRGACLEAKRTREGLSADEARELGDLERGAPAPIGAGFLTKPVPERPWQFRYWRSRSVGPIGAVLVVALTLVVVGLVFLRRPEVSWTVYVDRDGGILVKHPDDWVAEDLSGPDEELGQVTGVGVTAGDSVPSSFREAIRPPFPDATYGVLVFRETGTDPVPAVLAALDVPSPPRPEGAGLAGMDGKQVMETRDGIWRWTVYAEGSGRLVVFFARIPVESLDTAQPIVVRAEASAQFTPTSVTSGSPPPGNGL